jgi:hypothetical protein
MKPASPTRIIATRQRLARRIVVGAVIAGLALTMAFPKGSGASEFGALLLLMTLPMAAWVLILFAKKRAPMVATLPSFGADAPFVPHLQVMVTATATPPADSTAPERLALDGERYYLLLGSEGFSVRFRARESGPDGFDAQFLKPDEAVPRFVGGTAFHVFDGSKVVAQGTVVARIAEP